MRCSALIKYLADVIENHGDIDVVVIAGFENTTLSDIESTQTKSLVSGGDVLAVLHVS